jgi:spermidine synthase
MAPLLFFFASGASGLIYEIVWVRQFGLLFGSTVYSAALVTGIFMLGLGLGSWLAGRWADSRFASGPLPPLRTYGVFELLIAAWALALVTGIPALGALVAGASSYSEGVHGWSWLAPLASAVRYGSATLAILPVTLLMGGTLTLLIRHRIRADVANAGWQIAALYGVNTAGAALGCLLTDTALVPALGLRATQFVAIGLNLFAGLGALALARANSSGPAPEAAAPARGTAGRLDPTVAWAGVTLAIGGFAAMALQIVWFRFLISAYGAYRPVFSLLLTIILVGVWLGALLAGWAVRRGANAGRIYALSLAGIGIWASAALAFGPDDVMAHFRELAAGPGGAWPLYRVVLEGALGLVGIPALLSGAAYPLANALVQDRPDSVGRRAGWLYFANTLGSVSGSLVGGFVLLPRVGIQGSTAAVLGLLILATLTLALAIRPLRRDRILVGLCASGLLVALVAWQRLPPSALLSRTLGWFGDSGRIVSLREGVNETIAVLEKPTGRMLVTNSFAMSATTFLGQRYMRAFVHLPMLISDRIENVMVMCFGVGNTVSAALTHPEIRRVDVVDLSHEILEQAEHFAAANGHVLDDPRVRVHVNDGRHHLRMLDEPTYDLITGEPPPLPYAGVVNLYTREFFELARSRLRPGGIITYWLPAVHIGERMARSVVRTFLDVFPGALLLDGHSQQLILIGRKDAPLVLDPARARARRDATPGLGRELRSLSLGRPVEWVGLLAGTSTTLERASAGITPLFDDRPALEYEGRVMVRDRRLPADLFSVADADRWCPACAALPEAEREEIAAYLEVKAAWYRSPAFLTGLPDPSVYEGLSPSGRRIVARSLYLLDLFGRLPASYRNALAAERHGRYEEAVDRLRPLTRRRPGQLRLQLDFADLLARAGRAGDASELVGSLRRNHANDPIWRDWAAAN